MTPYRVISIKREFADIVEKFVKENPHFGYRSIASFMVDATRQRLENLGVMASNNVGCPTPNNQQLRRPLAKHRAR